MATRNRSTMAWSLAAWMLTFAIGLPAMGEVADRPWTRQYAGEEATGEHVIALWQFLPGQEATDNSGNGHDLALRGETRFAPGGQFGNCLEVSLAEEVSRSEMRGALARNRPELSPEGAFALELWIKPKPEFFQAPRAFLLDKKYVTAANGRPGVNSDYMLFLRRRGRGHQIVAYLGFGESSEYFYSDEVSFEAGEWAHVAFAYNGAGLGRFFLDGQPAGRTFHEGRGAISPGRRHLAIGDRLGSNYFPFQGFIDQVRILNDIPGWMAGRIGINAAEGRTVFRRMEPDATVSVTLDNDTDQPLTDVALRLSPSGMIGPVGGLEDIQFRGDGTLDPEKAVLVNVEPVPPARSGTLPVRFNSSLRPGEYELKVEAVARAGERTLRAETVQTITVVPRPLPHVLPVIHSGGGDLDLHRELGFTHNTVGVGVDLRRVWEHGPDIGDEVPDDIARGIRGLDARLARGMGIMPVAYSGRYIARRNDLIEKYQRVDRAGNPYDRENVCGLFPEVQEFSRNHGLALGRAYGRHPAFNAAKINTEIRDGTQLCFHDHDRAAYRAYSGEDIPEVATSKHGVHASRRSEFVPASGVVADDHPVLRFYRWFWREGDGWNELHSLTHRALHETVDKPDFFTFFDPAVRCPPVWGSGGEVDAINNWTYSYPDPPRIGLAADELFAMAAGRPGQRVMKGTQIIWYRRQTARNLPEREEDRADWEREEPEASFITISPDHLRETFWLKMARPLQGIVYHGWGSLVGSGHRSYRLTHHGTREVFAELMREVVRPLGPTLMQVPDASSDVAMLESFASTVFGTRGTFGWGRGWVGDAHLMLQWARLQPKIMYEEEIVRDGLEGVRVLVMPECPVLPQSAYERIREFQENGGIVVGDQNLAPALVPDVMLRAYERSGAPDEAKDALQEMAQSLREELAPVYEWQADSSDPDVIVRMRRYGGTDYLFAINDKRTYGDYVGHHRRVMEKGLPVQAALTLRRQGATVYDLVARQEIPARQTDEGMQWDVALGPGEGRVFMVAPRPIAAVQVEIAPRRPSDRQATVSVNILDAAGRPLDAVVPVRLQVLDPQGAEAEFSGYYGAKGGTFEVDLDLAPNDGRGRWTVEAEELASGRKGRATFEYRP